MTKYPEKRSELTAAGLAELNVCSGHPGIHRILEYISNAVGTRVGKRLEWCGTFCLFLLHRAGVALGVKWHIGGGFCEEQHLTKIVGKRTTRTNPKGEQEIYYQWDQLPEPGDIAYYDLPYRHHALVLAVNEGAGTFDSLDGNQIGDTIQSKHGIKLSKPTCFYSIEKLLDVEEALPEAQQEADDAEGRKETDAELTDTDPPAPPPVLKTGSEDREHVKILQQLLNAHGAHPPLAEDGDFGGLTGAALKNFQELNGLEGDEVCGPKTWAALLGAVPFPSPSATGSPATPDA